MAYTIDERFALPRKAASAVREAVAVQSSASTADEVLPLATSNTNAFIGLSIATAASPGDAVSVQYAGVGRAIAVASTGVGANVGVGSANGGLQPLASAATQHRVGISQTPAAAGEFFSVLIRPERVDF